MQPTRLSTRSANFTATPEKEVAEKYLRELKSRSSIPKTACPILDGANCMTTCVCLEEPYIDAETVKGQYVIVGPRCTNSMLTGIRNCEHAAFDGINRK